MPNYQSTIYRIKDVIVRKLPIASSEIAALAKEYSTITEEAVQRLDECCELLNKGLRSEAIGQAETPPALLDLIATVDFDGLDTWTNYTATNNLPTPAAINAGKVQLLQAAYGKQETLEPLQKIYRRLSIKGGSMAEKIAIVRKIRALDPANLNWPEDLKALEVARCKEIAEILYNNGDTLVEDEAAALLAELTDKQLLVIPAETLITSASAIHHSRKSVRVGLLMERLIERVNTAYAANDYEGVSGILKELEDVSKKEEIPLPMARASALQDVQYWFKEQKSKRGKAAALAEDMKMLGQLLEGQADPNDIHSQINKLEQYGEAALHTATVGAGIPSPSGTFGKGYAELMAEGRARVDCNERIVLLKHQTKLAVIGVAALVAVMLVGWITVSTISARKRNAIANSLRRATDDFDFMAAAGLVEKLRVEAPTLLEDPVIGNAIADFKKAQEHEELRKRRMETAFSACSKLDPFDPSLDGLISELNKSSRGDDEKARLAECKARLESARYTRLGQISDQARMMLADVNEFYKAAQNASEPESLRKTLATLDGLLLKIETLNNLPKDIMVLLEDYRKRHKSECKRLEDLVEEQKKTVDKQDRIQRELAAARRKLPNVSEYAGAITSMAEQFGNFSEADGLMSWKNLTPIYQAVAEYAQAMKNISVGREVPSYEKFLKVVLPLDLKTLAATPYTPLLLKYQRRAKLHDKSDPDLNDLYKLLEHDLMTKMSQFEASDTEPRKFYYTANTQHVINMGEGKVQVNVFTDSEMKFEPLLLDADKVSDIVPASHCELTAELGKRLKDGLAKRAWELDFPETFQFVLEYKDVNPWVHALLLQRLAKLDRAKIGCLGITAPLTEEISKLSEEKLYFWLTQDPNVQQQLTEIAQRLSALKPKLKTIVQDAGGKQSWRAKAEAVGLVRPLVLSAALGRDSRGNLVPHDILGQAHREYWVLASISGVFAFRIAAYVDTNGQLKWIQPETLIPGQPLLSPDDSLETNELYQNFSKGVRDDPVPPWPVNMNEVKL